MNVVYVADDNYAKHLGISLNSLLENNKSLEIINIYIISVNIGEDKLIKLKNTVNKYKRKLEIINFSNILNEFNYTPDTSRFGIAAYGRLFLDILLPQTLDKVLYLDVDTLVLNDISKLYNLNIDKYLLAMSLEPTINKQIKIDIGLYENSPYYNSGVILFNLKRWRKENARITCLNYLESIKDISLFPDQDAINGSFIHKIKPLSPKYNFISNFKYWSYESLVENLAAYKIFSKKVFENAKKNPSILHFAGDERPWKKYNFNPYKKIYFKYKNISLFKDEKLDDAKFSYMLFYHLVNLLTLICPRIRKFISNIYINKLRKERFNNEN